MKYIIGISAIVLILAGFSLEGSHANAAFAIGLIAGVIGLVAGGVYHARKEGY